MKDAWTRAEWDVGRGTWVTWVTRGVGRVKWAVADRRLEVGDEGDRTSEMEEWSEVGHHG